MMFVRIIICLFILIFTIASCFGTTCVNFKGLSEKEFRKLLDQNTAIFFGEVIAVQPPVDRTQNITVRVIRAWKGINDNQVDLLYVGASEPFIKEIGEIGTQTMFYAETTEEGSLRTSYCSFHSLQQNEVDEQMKAYLGEGQPIEQTITSSKQDAPSFFSWLWNRITSIFRAS